jgi:hypothetical protein
MIGTLVRALEEESRTAILAGAIAFGAGGTSGSMPHIL